MMSAASSGMCTLLALCHTAILLLIRPCSAYVAAPNVCSDRYSLPFRRGHKNEGRLAAASSWRNAVVARKRRVTRLLSSSAASDSNEPLFRYHHVTDVKRVFCLSDLHTDHVDNMRWLRDRVAASSLSRSDLLIVAGDISHEFLTFKESLKIVCDICQVLFVPGNHEAWLNQHERNEFASSLEKLDQCNAICREHGAYVDPVYIAGPHPVWILPLQSWYDGTLSFDEELCQGFEHWPWVDFARCKWEDFPEMESPNARIPLGLTEYFLERNRVNILEPWRALIDAEGSATQAVLPAVPVVTVSHFAPNQQCLPDWKDLESREFLTGAWLDHGAGHMSAKFAKVAGSALLGDQIRTIMPRIHVFGHSHRPKDFKFRDIRYIHNPLGKPRERQLHMVSPNVDFQCIWDIGAGEVNGETVIRYWEEHGGGKEMLWKRMAKVRPGRYQHDGRGRLR